jgi:hypothetical protein
MGDANLDDPSSSPSATALVAGALLTIYTAPALGLIIALCSTNMASRDSWYFEFFFTLAKSHGDVMTEIHQLLLPLLSLFSIATFRHLGRRQLLFLGGMVFLGFLVVVGLQVWVGTPQIRKNIAAWRIGTEELTAADAMLRRMRESQMMYLAILIGLRLPTRSKRGVAPGGGES